MALLVRACGCTVTERKVELQGSTPASPTPEDRERRPTAASSPVEEGGGGWKVTGGDTVTLMITAPGASEVAVLHRPVIADEQDGHFQLKKLTGLSEGAGGKFQTDIRPPADFARGDSKRRVLRPEGPLPVDINYDTEVVEGGVLHVYPDVYDRKASTVERLREDLRAAGVGVSKLGERAAPGPATRSA